MPHDRSQIDQILMSRGIDPTSGAPLPKEDSARALTQDDIDAILKKRGLSPNGRPLEESWDQMGEGEWEKMLDRPLIEGGKQQLKTARNVTSGLGGGTIDLAALPFNLAGASIPSATEGIKKVFDTATGGISAPENNTEKILEVIGEGAGNMAGLGGAAKLALRKGITKSGSKPDKFLKFAKDSSALTGANFLPMSVGVGTSQHILNQDPNSHLAALFGGLGAGMATNPVLGAIKGVAQKGFRKIFVPEHLRSKASPSDLTPSFYHKPLAKALGINPNKVETALESGMPLTMNAVTDSPTIQGGYNILRKTPFAQKRIRDKEALQAKHFEDLSGVNEEEAKRFTSANAGEIARKGAFTYRDKVHDKMKDYETRLTDLALQAKKDGHTGIVDVSDPYDLLLSKKEKLRGKNAREKFDATKEGKILEDLDAERLMFDGGVPLPNLMAMQERLQNQISTFGEIGKKEQGALKHLRSTIKNSLDKYWESISPEAAKLVKEKNAYYAQYAQDVKPNLNSILKPSKHDSTKAFKKVFEEKGSEALLKPLYEVFTPEEKKDFTKHYFAMLGDTSKSNAHGNSTFNAFRAGANFKKLSPANQERLLEAYTPEVQTKFKKVMETIGNIGEGLGEANTSQTAHVLDRMEWAKNMSKNAGMIGVGLAAGNGLLAAKSAALLTLPAALVNMTARKLTNPNTINKLYKGLKSDTYKNRGSATNQFLRVLKNTHGKND